MSADPITLPALEIGEYAVYAAVNALSAEKILPQSFRPVILLPPGSEESLLREIMDQIGRVCASEGLAIEGGHTEVTAAVTTPVVIGCCTGVPMASSIAEDGVFGESAADRAADVSRAESTAENCRSGDSPAAGQPSQFSSAVPRQESLYADRIVMTKWAGMEASCILAREKEELRELFPETILHRMRKLGELLSVKKEAVICAEEGAAHLTDLSEGGLYAALWQLARKARCGLRIDLPSVPVLQETIEFANHYDIDPYKMRSAGSLLAVTHDADALTARLAESGIPAAVIGSLSQDNDKVLIGGGEIRYLDLPQPDELLKIM